MTTIRFFALSLLFIAPGSACSDPSSRGEGHGALACISEALTFTPPRSSLVNHRIPTPMAQSSLALTWDDV